MSAAFPEIEEATREGVIPLIGVYGKSGSGKTHSALLLARGIAGNKAIAIIDTESKRSGVLVGLIPGGFKRINMEPPFTPDKYINAIGMLETHSIGAAVIDSMTHEWSGEGGILEWQDNELDRMAGTDWQKREACKMSAWIKPKMAHKALVKRILRAKIPLVCCLRADEKTHIDQKKGEKTRVVTDDFTTPDFDKKFVFEMLVNLETQLVDGKPGCVVVRKWSHADLLKCLPGPGQQLGVEHGAAIARWCAGTGGVPTTGQPAAASKKKVNAEEFVAKRELWSATESIHGGSAGALEQWLWDEALLADDKTLADIDEAGLRAITRKAREKLKV